MRPNVTARASEEQVLTLDNQRATPARDVRVAFASYVDVVSGEADAWDPSLAKVVRVLSPVDETADRWENQHKAWGYCEVTRELGTGIPAGGNIEIVVFRHERRAKFYMPVADILITWTDELGGHEWTQAIQIATE